MRVNEGSMIWGPRLRSIPAADESLHAVADHRELRVLVSDDLGRVGVRDTAQGESERARALGKRDRVHFVRAELECRGLADRDAFAVLLLDIGADGEDADVLQQSFAGVDVAAL